MYNNYNDRRPSKPQPMIPHQPSSQAPAQQSDKKGNFALDVVKDTAGYLWGSIIKTSLLKLLDNIIVGTKDKILWNGQSQNTSQNYTNYSSPYKPTAMKIVRRRYDEVPIPTKDQAIAILNEMHRRISYYGDVTVADVYTMLNEPTEWTDNNY